MRLLRALLLPPLVIALVVGTVFVGLSGFRATQAVRELRAAATASGLLGVSLREGDVASARGHLRDVESLASQARSRLRGPSWSVTARLPGIGDDVAAVRRASALVAGAAADLGPGLLDSAERVRADGLRPVDGRVDVPALQAEAETIDDAAVRLRRIAIDVGLIDLEHVVPDIRSSVSVLGYSLSQTSDLLTELSRAADALPVALGLEAPRRYLLLLTDATRSRAGDGIPVRYAVVEAVDGSLVLGEQGRVDELEGSAPLPLTASDEVSPTRLAGRPVTSLADVTVTPDYEESARLARELWAVARPSSPVDAVVTLDTHALASLETVVRPGGDPAPAGTVPADRLPDVLGAVLAGAGDSPALFDALSEAARQQRLRIWSDDPVVQRQVDAGGLGGGISGQRFGVPVLSTYLNADDDGPGLRLVGARVRLAACVGDVTRLRLVARVSSTDVLAGDSAGQQAGDGGTVDGELLVYGPSGGSASREVSVDGGDVGTVRTGTVRSRPTLRVPVSVPAGGSAVVRGWFSTAPGQRAEPILRVGPADPVPQVRVDRISCPRR